MLVAFAGAVLAGLADDLAGARIAVALGSAGRIIAEDETVLLDSAQRNLDDAVFVFADDRFFGDDVGDIFANRFANFLPMPQPVAGGTIRPLSVGDPVFAEDSIAGSLEPSARLYAS